MTSTSSFPGSSPEEKLRVGFSAPSWRSVRQLLDPLSMVFWVGGSSASGVLFVRSRWFPPARECTKCGKVYRLDDEPGESPVYCRQCVSVFLQRDLVPIDQQTAKLAQVRRWDRMVDAGSPADFGRRARGVPARPGSGGFGVVIGLVAWISLVGMIVWVPRFLEVIEPTMPVQPVVVVLVRSSSSQPGCEASSHPGNGGDVALEGTLRDFLLCRYPAADFAAAEDRSPDAQGRTTM